MTARAVPAGLLAHYQLSTTTLCYLLKITRPIDGLSFGYTNLNSNIVVAGFTYQAGLDVSNIQTTAGVTVGNMDISIFPDANFNAADLLAGKWNGAVFTLGICNWRSPADGVDILKTGKTGEAELTEQGYWKLEFRGLLQALQQAVGEVTQKSCKADLGDERCKVNLTYWTQNSVLTSVASSHVVTASGIPAPDDYFTEGKFSFTSGPNAGYWFKVKRYQVGGIFTFQVSLPFAAAVGDAFTAIAGCQKRLIPDCKEKFNNVLNFQGEPHLPGQDRLLADPSTDAANGS